MSVYSFIEPEQHFFSEKSSVLSQARVSLRRPEGRDLGIREAINLRPARSV